MVGDITGTVVTIFAGREDVQSLLPPELTFANDDTLPAWLRERDGHPVIAIIGSNEIGRRKRTLGRYHTVPLFPNFLETFVAVPYLRPVDGADSETCFHFARVYCQKFWPTEVGRLCVGWPKQQCPMRLSQEGDVQRYEIEQNGRPLLTASTDLANPTPLTPSQESLSRIVAMLSQPLVLIKNGKLRRIDWNLRFNSARLAAVPADVTQHPGFFPSLTKPLELSFPQMSDSEFGAFHLETTFLNRGEV